MVLIYSAEITSRLQYVTSFIFKEVMDVDIAITTNIAAFHQYDGIKINYSNTNISDCKFSIANSSLLFERDTKEQNIECFTINNYKAFFKINDSNFPFDIFAASFYLISRYEEYLPHTKDMYGRYAHENSIAYKEGFLNLPLINIWIKDFAIELKKQYPMFNVQYSMFRFLPSYDIDIAYSYKHKGFARNFGGALKSIISFQFSDLTERLAVLMNKKKDPYDIFDWLDKLHQQHNLNPIYFFLVAENNGLYDKNILPDKIALAELIKQQADKYTIGIHPSWRSVDNFDLLKKEKAYLEATSKKLITNSRQHYIRFNLPEGYRQLIDADIKDDYSMGYGSINGFRASIASSFYWYDLMKEEQTRLRIHPFCYMEANSYYEQKFSAEEAYTEMIHYYNSCKDVNGTFISIWHNHSLGSDKHIYPGWNKVYEKFLRFLSQQ